MTQVRTALLGIGLVLALPGAPAAQTVSWAYRGEITDVANEVSSTFTVQFKNLASFSFTGITGKLEALEVAPVTAVPVPGMAFWSAALVTLALLGVGFRAAALGAR